jgi:hypothetical protein
MPRSELGERLDNPFWWSGMGLVALGTGIFFVVMPIRAASGYVLIPFGLAFIVLGLIAIRNAIWR